MTPFLLYAGVVVLVVIVDEEARRENLLQQLCLDLVPPHQQAQQEQPPRHRVKRESSSRKTGKTGTFFKVQRSAFTKLNALHICAHLLWAFVFFVLDLVGTVVFMKVQTAPLSFSSLVMPGLPSHISSSPNSVDHVPLQIIDLMEESFHGHTFLSRWGILPFENCKHVM